MGYSRSDKVLLWLLGMMFAGLNALDLGITWVLMRYGGHESNPIPALMFAQFGFGVSAVVLTGLVVLYWVYVLEKNKNSDHKKYAVMAGVWVVNVIKMWVIWRNFMLIPLIFPLA